MKFKRERIKNESGLSLVELLDIAGFMTEKCEITYTKHGDQISLLDL